LCFLGGFLPGGANDRETVHSQYVLVKQEDVSVDLTTSPEVREDTSLLKRGDQARGAVKSAGGKVFRQGTLDSPAIRADEWLAAGPTAAGLYGYAFTLEANATTSRPQAPFLSLDMSVGDIKQDANGNEIAKASLTEGESIALWDAVSRSLRPRPNGFWLSVRNGDSNSSS
jgi:Tle cognate immunity protein 4 C-terminal domain